MDTFKKTTESNDKELDEMNNRATNLHPNNDVCPEDILNDAGGCGRYQIRMSIVVHLIKTITCFSTYNLVIFSAAPKWYCNRQHILANDTCFQSNGVCRKETDICTNINDTACTPDPEFNTYVGEFHLVCDRDFIPNTINSLHIGGICIGNLMGGQLADLFGRKRTFFGSLIVLLVFHLMAYFSTNWQMLAAAFVFTGIGCGFFLTVQFTLMSEYSLARWRVWMIGFPSLPLQSCLFALVAWLIHDWRHLQLMTALMVLPTFLAWFVLPESFRWYIAHNNPNEAVNVIETVAKVNRMNDYQNIAQNVHSVCHHGDNPSYTFIHLFNTKHLAKMTFLLMVVWASLDIMSYGIVFGLQTLAGNIYLNLFLFSVAGIPSKATAIWLQNSKLNGSKVWSRKWIHLVHFNGRFTSIRFGRRVAVIVGLSVFAIAGLAAGIVQTINVTHKDVVTSVCTFLANAGVASVWGSLQTMTIEIYPTVIRNIGFGFLNVVGKSSAVIGPQIVYLNSFAPGVLFFVCAGLAILSISVVLFLPETMDQNLRDNIELKTNMNDSIDNRTDVERV